MDLRQTSIQLIIIKIPARQIRTVSDCFLDRPKAEGGHIELILKFVLFVRAFTLQMVTLHCLHCPPQNNPSPMTPMHLCQRFLQSLKHAEKSSTGIAFNDRTVSRSISSINSNRFPRNDLLSFGNSQKSHGIRWLWSNMGRVFVNRGTKSKSCWPIP